MKAIKLEDGQYFQIDGDSRILRCVDDHRPEDWGRYPGIVYRDTASGLHGGLGGGNSVTLCNAPENEVTQFVKPAPRWMTEMAKKYSVSVDVIKDENYAFLQSEGYFETASRVIECKTFDFWMRLYAEKRIHRTPEPYQKGDLGYGL